MNPGQALEQPIPMHQPLSDEDAVNKLAEQLPDEDDDYKPDPDNAKIEGEEQPEEKPDEEKPEEGEEKPEEQEEVRVKFKIKGEDGQDTEVEKTIEELTAGYMMQADYQRKTAALAREREQLPSTIQEAVGKEREQYIQSLGTLHNAVYQTALAELGNVDLRKLRYEDPAQYVQVQGRIDDFKQLLGNIQQEQQRVADTQQKEVSEKQAKAISEAKATLQRDIPNWSTDLYQKLLQAGIKEYGFAPEEVGTIVDARYMKVLHDAYQYRQLKAQKPLAEKKVVTVPKVVKPGAAPTKNVDAKIKFDRFKKTRSDADAVNWLMERM